ncbi:MAG: hypothetical protein KBB52_07025 [Candidatus Omnitrophica bacterium]|nr:hypothetical protein [Candidatus Omnitrophota bacterium]
MDSLKLKHPVNMKNKILAVLFAAWVVMWVAFTLRELFLKVNLRDYMALISRSAEGKRAYVTGEELYGFIESCKNATPEDASYDIAGLEDGSIEKRRLVYYLYPRRETDDADFIFVYRSPGFGRAGYMDFKRFDDSKYILKKISGR